MQTGAIISKGLHCGAAATFVAAVTGSLFSVTAFAEGAGSSRWTNRLEPVEAGDWNYDRAAHLLERAGFGGTPEEIERLAAMTPADAVDFLVDFESIGNGHLEPFDHSGVFRPGMDPFPMSRADAVRQAREHGEALGVKVNAEGSRRIQPVVNEFFYGLRANELECRRASLWWANRMLRTHRPLEEKMALFWHGHFATSDTKVRDYRKLVLQLALFHRHAVGNFGVLLLGVTQDPGMLAFLDNAENRKGHPNENFGRELMELFSMGVGHYTERDIREAARAFTGWTDDKLTFVVKPEEHDDGEKNVLGRKGHFDGEDVIRIILDQPATAAFISAKIYRFFVREALSPEVHEHLAAMLRDHDYELKPLLKRIFLSKDFYSRASYGAQIKDPVTLMVSTYRKLGLKRIPTIPDFNSETIALGQFLFHPPNVAGWSGGRTWITPATLLERGNAIHRMLFPNVENFRPPDRSMPWIYRRVGERMAQGMNITQATAAGDSAFNQMADSDEDFNTRYAGYLGYLEAYRIVKPIPRFPADADLAALLRERNIKTPKQAVAHFFERFFRVQPPKSERTAIAAFLEERIGGKTIDYEQAGLEETLRLTLHLILSAPEYQLG